MARLTTAYKCSKEMQQLDLRKQIVLDLKKQIGLEGQKASVILVLDKSGSMSSMYQNGKVQELLERILPLGLGFDDDGEVDFYIFHNQAFRHKTPITRQTISNITSEVIRMYDYQGTSYAPPIKMILDQWVGAETKGGFFSKAGRPSKTFTQPLYVIYVTDGQNDDKVNTEEILREASKYPIFFQFVGLGSDSFTFLQKLDNLTGREMDNAGFFQANDISRMTDEDLYTKMMVEFPAFVNLCKQKRLI